MILLKFKKLHLEATIPKYQTAGSVGLDVYAYLMGENDRAQKLMLPPRTVRPCPTGVAFELDPGHNGKPHYVQVVSRSGMVRTQCVSVANAPGIIDLDYRGELIILLYNGGIETQWIQHGNRIAQLLVTPFYPVYTTIVDVLSETKRGAAGFGSTGQ